MILTRREVQILEPATAAAAWVVERVRQAGILISSDGPHNNVLKLKPPLVFSQHDAARLLATLDRILSEDAVRQRNSPMQSTYANHLRNRPTQLTYGIHQRNSPAQFTYARHQRHRADKPAASYKPVAYKPRGPLR